MKSKLALISDFDGTISEKDFFDSVIEKYFDESALEPWREFIRGEKTHFDALKEIFAQIHVPEEDLINFINNLHIDKKFFEVCSLCSENEIPIYICSAGCDYYIRIMIGHEIDDYNIKLVTNYSFYSPTMGLQMQRPFKTEKYYDFAVGINKAKLAEDMQSQGYKVIYCGDGIPDLGAARISDVVFAKSVLKEICQKEGITTQKFNDFNDVYRYIEENK